MTEQERNLFIKRMKTPFKFKNSLSNKSKSSIKREKSKEVILSRITSQIIEIHSLGLGYKTPEEWDESFYKLGGGRGRRKSSSIISRMRWSDFLEEFDKIISNLS